MTAHYLVTPPAVLGLLAGSKGVTVKLHVSGLVGFWAEKELKLKLVSASPQHLLNIWLYGS